VMVVEQNNSMFSLGRQASYCSIGSATRAHLLHLKQL
jgi:hypothetical protein